MWTASFSLPLDDPKNSACQPLNYVEITNDITSEYVGLFRIVPSLTVKDENTSEVTYQLNHVITTLMDDVLFKYHQTDNLTTAQNINYLLARQTVKNWELGGCAFVRYFSYKWENENGLLGPLFSIASPFDEQYEFSFDTTSYPWRINLIRPPTEPTCEVRYAKNMRGIERDIDPVTMINRIYPLGYGEGNNQLTIESVNGGVPYLENSASILNYGLQAYVWVDRRFENAETLKASAQARIDSSSMPRVVYRVSAADLFELTGADVDKLRVGRIVRVIDPDIGTFNARIVSESKADIYAARGEVDLEIGNISADLGTTQADIERRQEINELYAQGATNIDSRDFSDNCDPNYPAIIRFPIPDDVVNINEMLLTFETQNYRAYSRAIEGGGGTYSSTQGGGGIATTSGSGGAYLDTSTAENYRPGTDGHDHGIPDGTRLQTIPAGGITWVKSGQHTHNVNLPSHTHPINLPQHTHDFSIGSHTHEIDYGIFEYPTFPSNVTVRVDGTTVPISGTSGDNINLIPYLPKDSSGKILRGSYVTITITPNTLARINATVTSRLFIQSRGGGVF